VGGVNNNRDTFGLQVFRQTFGASKTANMQLNFRELRMVRYSRERVDDVATLCCDGFSDFSC
jgi:hypothetical protein